MQQAAAAAAAAAEAAAVLHPGQLKVQMRVPADVATRDWLRTGRQQTGQSADACAASLEAGVSPDLTLVDFCSTVQEGLTNNPVASDHMARLRNVPGRHNKHTTLEAAFVVVAVINRV